jgi:uncharacterized protein (TIGR00297 family)
MSVMLELIFINTTLVILGLIAWSKQRVSASGFFSIVIISSLCIWTRNGEILSAMGVMFITSTSLTKYKSDRKKMVRINQTADSKRNWMQAFCNLGPACIWSLLNSFNYNECFVFAAFASVAAANADTWASELGILSKKPARFILSGKVVPTGLSGGVTLLGTTASLFGAIVISLVFWIFFKEIQIAAIIVLFGFAGSVIDSILGEFFQASYKNQKGDLQEDSANADLYKGYAWINNNIVNLMSTSLISVISYLVFRKM